LFDIYPRRVRTRAVPGRGAVARSQGTQTTEFRAFLQEDWGRWLSEYPELATSFGFPGSNDRWTDDSPTGIERRRSHLRETKARLDGIRPQDLPISDQLDFEIYRELTERATEGVGFGLDPLPFDLGQPHDLRMPMNQLEGVQMAATEALDLAPRVQLRDFEDRLSRLRRLPELVRQQIALMEAGRAAGVTPPRVAVAALPEQIRSLGAPAPGETALLDSFDRFPPSIGPSDARRLPLEARRIHRDEIVPALHDLDEYLTARYLPQCRETIAATALPRGPEVYAYLVRRMTTTGLSPAEIHEIGLREVRQRRAEIEAIMRTTGFAGSFDDFKQFLRRDPRFFLRSPEELVDGYRIIAKTVDPELGRLFGTLPRLPYGVLPVPAFRERASPGAYYIGGAPATGRAGYFYANTYEIGVRPRWEMEDLCLHEAVPGHHLQVAIAQELTHLPDFRRFTGPVAFVEGWGLYAETLGDELGLYRDPYAKVGQLLADAWRGIRLVVDTGMHALGWSRDRAIEFFRENSAQSDVSIAVEVDRYIVWPGQALGYKVGQLKIRELRSFAEGRLRDRFDVRGFHDLVLGEGAIPLGRLEDRVHRWVAADGAT
jgi:uncharacterized protein (DUF885 family)